MTARNLVGMIAALAMVAVTSTASVVSFTLINADSNTDIQQISDGDTINLATLPTQNINIRANVDVTPSSVTMTLSGATSRTQTESIAPYALWQDTDGDYKPASLNIGAHTLSATPTPGSAYTVNFTVIDSATGLPTANAGPNKALTLPANSTTLSGSGSDDGSITSYAWTQQSGPNTATLGGQTTPSLSVSGLIAGTYVMRLTVTDNDGNTAFDEAQIFVSPSAPPAPEGAFLESGGLVVMEVESAPATGGWDSRTEIAGYTGTEYYYCTANSFNSGGADTLSYEFTVANAGDYQVQVRSRIAEGTSNTDANDSFIRLVDSSGTPVTPIPNENTDTASWYKFYQNVMNSWTWNTSNKDNDAHALGWTLSAGQTYKLQLSRRSAGHAIDKIVLWNRTMQNYGDNRGYASNGATLDSMPESDRATTGTDIIYIARTDFPNISAGEVPYYVDATRDALAIDAAIESYRGKFARAERTFDGPSGFYDVTITTLTEEDGESTYRLLVNGAVVAAYQNPRVDSAGDSLPQTHTWAGITVNAGDTIAIESDTHSNGLIPEGAGFAWARGRWRQVEFTTGNGGSADGIYGDLKKWHKVTILFDGPSTSETAAQNPFLDYRLNVTFTHPDSGKTYLVPGYYAADGNAAESGTDSGNKWAVHFSPDETGTWNYTASFRTGANVAIDSSPTAGTGAGFCDGANGSLSIAATDKTGRDHRGKGRLQYVGEHYLRFAETDEYFLKQGSDSPENLLAYEDFDNTPDNGGRLKSWAPHAGDWQSGDPSWQSGKGTELIGAVNYIASEGLNAMSFLTMSADGDDRNVFMWRGPTDYQHYDVSKCAQWEIVFEHMDAMGIYLHFKTQETENDQKLDGGALGTNRKLYYRELIARFGHHLALNWNLGEENTNTDQQRKDFAQFFYDNDPYRHNVVVHTYPGDKNTVYTPLLGNNSKLTGVSLQSSWNAVDSDTEYWVKQSAAAGKKWVVANDEQGGPNEGIMPDSSSNHDGRRKETLWGGLLSGGAGNEYYFGYSYPNSDLTCQDFRSRDQWWDYCRYALEFFRDNDIPVQQMINDNSKSSASSDYCFYKQGDVYVVYLRDGGTTSLDLTGVSGEFTVSWFNPRAGGSLQNGSVSTVSGGGSVSLGNAPADTSLDWTILIQKDGTAPANEAPSVNAGQDVLISLPTNTVPLSGTATDDGLPGGTLTTEWSKVSGPGTVSFGDASALSTPAVFSSAGEYVLRLTADDSTRSSSDDVTVTVVSAPVGQSPYGGTPRVIPGRIQAEDYDIGDEGVAYHDTGIGNSGKAYRSDSVDIQATSDVDGGYNVGWIAAGEWLEYTVNIAASGIYDIDFRVASSSAGGNLHVEFDGTDKTGQIQFPGTGGWQTWTTVSINGVALEAGEQVMRIAMESGDWNLNHVTFISAENQNEVPVANAGADQTVTDLDGNGTESVMLSGAGSTDQDGTIVSYVWTEGTTQLATGVNPTVALAAGTHTITLTVIDDSGATGTDTVVVTVNSAPTTGEVVFAVNAGGGEYTGVDGTIYSADYGMTGGRTYGTSAAITGTEDDTLYQSERYGNFSYNVPVDDGDYTVLLKFAENYWTAAGKRVFDVSIEDTEAATDLDIFAEAGKNAAYDVTIPVTVEDGMLSIIFSTDVDNAKISAVRVARAGTPPPPTTYDLTVNSGSGDGAYEEGTVVTITADAAPAGQVFDGWTGDTAAVADVNSSGTSVIMPAMAVSLTATYRDSFAVAINCGGGAYTSADGTAFTADQYYSGGSTYSISREIANTEDDDLYRAERYGNVSYQIPVPDGDYAVTLKFAEIFHTSPGKRLFAVNLEGSQVLDSLDLFATVGLDMAYDMTFVASVSDGYLSIDITTLVDNAKISAILVQNQAPVVPINQMAELTEADIQVEPVQQGTNEDIYLYGMNGNGISAGYVVVSNVLRGIVVGADGSILRLLGTLGGSDSAAMAISDGNLVVGTAADASGISRAVLWYSDGSIVDLNSMLSPADAAVWQLEYASDIDDTDTIVGGGTFNGQRAVFMMQLR